jgi:uncharacterized membrane protein YfcA
LAKWPPAQRAGFFAGLLGIGGGSLMVPVLVMMFTAQAFPAGEVMHLALGTSMATILFTSISSVRTHHAHGAVLWPVVARITPGIILGTLLGTHVASLVPTKAAGPHLYVCSSATCRCR